MTIKERVIIDRDNHVAHVRMARTDRANSLDLQMFQALIEAGKEIISDTSIRAVILSGDGEGFCAGIDFDVLNAMQGGSIGGITDLAAPTHGICNIFQYSAFVWQTVPVPVIAAVHGYALGGGLEIALGADIRYVTPDTRFAVKEVVMGLIPDVGGIVYMRDLARADIVRELMFTGREFDGNAAVEYGLATRTMDDPLAGAWSTAKEIACKSPDAIRALKRVATLGNDARYQPLFLAEGTEQQALVGTENQTEAVQAYFEKRPANFK
ncbi:MAG: crotonase/enoyl-CoA hydratase family protein [Rhizobiaceae bacterium]|nr:crotonase/enoyl-CoA hydratase family protein [Rhizobiaceae bacterium]